MAGVERKPFDDVLRTNEKGEPVPNTSPPIYSADELAAIKREADR
jgi:hypothetical protein